MQYSHTTLPHPTLFVHILALHRVLCLAQSRHYINAFCLSSELLNGGVLQELVCLSLLIITDKNTYVKSHEDIVFLPFVSAYNCLKCIGPGATYFLITNSEFALGLLVLVGEGFELLDGLGLQDLDAKLHIALGVLMARLELLLAHIETQDNNLHLRIRWYLPAEQQVSHSMPYPSPWRCLRRIVRSLSTVSDLYQRWCQY